MESKQIKTEQTGEKKPRKRRGFLRKATSFLLVLLLVLAAAVLSTMEDGKHFASLRRWLMYGESGATQDLYTYAPHQGNRAEQLGEYLLLANPNGILLLQQGGAVLYELETTMHSPMISVGNELAAVCDTGGSTVYVLDRSGLLWTHTAPEGLVCYSARVSENDCVIITEQKSGFKTSVASYNKNGSLLFRFDSHDNYIGDAAMSDDGSALVAVSLEARSGVFASNLVVFEIETAERTGEYELRDGLVLDFTITGNNIVTLCDKRLVVTTLDGETTLNFAYGERYLHNYALTGEDFCALLLGRYQSSNICQLVTFGLDGEELATLELTEEVLDMSAAGGRLAVLYSDALVVYDRMLNEVARLDGTDYAGRVQISNDGTVLLIAETSAWRFLP